VNKLPAPDVVSREALAASDDNMLETINLYKTYTSDGADYEVLKNINLQINQGECAAIIGKSGSGKSTLMHLLACLDAPTSGSIMLDGADVSEFTEKEKNALRNEKFGFVFQQFFLNGRETVLENVILPMRIRGATQYRMIKDAMDALEAVGLKNKEDKRAKDLSGGEKQRVCIARALVGNPQIVFADEPTGNLDSNTSESVENMLFELNRQKGITLIVVTHDNDLARKCRRVIELKDGEIVSSQVNS
jgi:putative ABC transport system ATP-binding protein